MYKLPVDPYYVNAATWWLENRNANNDEFRAWLECQGVTIKNRDSYYPWLDFESPLLATLFRIKWGSVVSTQH
jgi:hypothetical protein